VLSDRSTLFHTTRARRIERAGDGQRAILSGGGSRTSEAPAHIFDGPLIIQAYRTVVSIPKRLEKERLADRHFHPRRPR